ncbi:MAG: hypothetical protein HY248_05185 [Fimbriimonas ginsengisoli]|nr:hypothetical protein [Fimbriimonas ginsengisoli]
MFRKLIIAILVIAPLAAVGQQAATPAQVATTISVSADGTDVKKVLRDLFTQAKKSYVVQPGIYFALHLALEGVDFDEALAIVCKVAGVKAELQNGIYFVSKDSGGKAKAKPVFETAPRLTGVVPPASLAKPITTRLARAELSEVLASFGKQTGVLIELDRSVPAYKIDAFLIRTPLRSALTRVTKAAGLAFELTDHQSIKVYKPEAEKGRVSAATG